MSRRASAAQVGRGAMVTMTNNPLPYVVPAAGAVVNLVLSGALSLIWGAYSGPGTVWQTAWRSALIVLASLAVIMVTWAAGRARQPVLRTVSMGMSVCSCTGLFVLTFHGWSRDLVLVYVLVMAVCCLGLAIVRLLRGDGGDARPHPFGAVAERVNELRAVGELSRPKVVDGTVVTRVRMEQGTEFSELQKARGAIASMVPTARQNVRLIPDPERPGEGDMEITGRDFIAKPPTWPGLSAPGGCISAPLHLAVYGNGRTVPLYLPGDPQLHRNAIGLLVIVGQPGAGKTELVLAFSGEVISRHNADLTLVDCRKGAQLPAWLKRAARVISDVGEAESFIAGLVDQVPARAEVLGAEGLKEWTPASSLPFRVVILDEAAKLIATGNEEEMVELAESIRSVGICIVLVMQRVTVDRMPSSVKKARGGAICMGVSDDKEAGRILSEQTIEAGASPGSLQNRKPGCLYAEVPGIPEEDWSRMARTYQPPTPAELAAAVEPFATRPTPRSTPAGPAPASAQARPAPTGAPRHSAPDVELIGTDGRPIDLGGDTDRDRITRDPDRLDLRDDDPEARPEPQYADTPLEEGGDPRTPIGRPSAPRMHFSPDEQQWTKSDLIELIRRTLLDAHANGRTRIRPADLGPVVEHVGPDNLKPPRLSSYLGELCKPGPGRLLRRDRDSGWYVIEPDDSGSVRELVDART